MEDRPPIPQSRGMAERSGENSSAHNSAPPPKLPQALRHEWRQAMRTQAWCRKQKGWTAIVMTNTAGYRVVLKRTVRTFEDALASANEALNPRYE